jgi:hypothetical protein
MPAHLPGTPPFLPALPSPPIRSFHCLAGEPTSALDAARDTKGTSEMDVLGDILSTLELRSTVYFRAELSAPFSIAVPEDPWRMHKARALLDRSTRSVREIAWEVGLTPQISGRAFDIATVFGIELLVWYYMA